MDTREIILPQGMSTSGAGDSFLGGAGIGTLLIGALLFGNRGFGFGGGYGGGWGGQGGWGTAAKTDVVLEPAFQSLQNQIQGLSGQLAANDIRNELESMETDISSQIRSDALNLANGQRDIVSTLGDIQTAAAAANFTTLNSINGLGRDVTAQANQNALQQLNSFNNLTTTTLQGFNSTAMQNQNSLNQIIAQGTANAAANAAGFCQISREMATCCCELKQAIAADGDETRALINSIYVQNLQGQLADAKTQVTTLNQTIAQKAITDAQTATILHHLLPREEGIVA